MMSRRATRSSTCVNKAIARLKANGGLKAIERIWLRKATGALELT